MAKYPVCPVCPQCGDPGFVPVPSHQVIALDADRQCAGCATRYSPPAPRWAAIALVIVGITLLIEPACIIWGNPRLSTHWLIALWGTAACVFGFFCAIRGVESLFEKVRKSPEEPAAASPVTAEPATATAMTETAPSEPVALTESANEIQVAVESVAPESIPAAVAAAPESAALTDEPIKPVASPAPVAVEATVPAESTTESPFSPQPFEAPSSTGVPPVSSLESASVVAFASDAVTPAPPAPVAPDEFTSFTGTSIPIAADQPDVVTADTEPDPASEALFDPTLTSPDSEPLEALSSTPEPALPMEPEPLEALQADAVIHAEIPTTEPEVAAQPSPDPVASEPPAEISVEANPVEPVAADAQSASVSETPVQSSAEVPVNELEVVGDSSESQEEHGRDDRATGDNHRLEADATGLGEVLEVTSARPSVAAMSIDLDELLIEKRESSAPLTVFDATPQFAPAAEPVQPIPPAPLAQQPTAPQPAPRQPEPVRPPAPPRPPRRVVDAPRRRVYTQRMSVVSATPSTPAKPAPEHNLTGIDYRAPMPWPKVRGSVIDFHCHLLAARHARTWFEAAWHYGIDHFVTMTPLEEAMGLARDYPDRLHFIAVPQWYYEGSDFIGDWLKRIEMFYNLGSRMVKFHMAPQTIVRRGWRLDSPQLEPVFREIEARGMMIMSHVGDPETWYTGRYADTARYGTRDEHYTMWANVMETYHHIPWVGAHLGGNPEDLNRLQSLLDRFPNLSLDCSATRWMAREVSARRDDARDFFIRNADRILFGSDQVSGDDRGFDFLASRFWVHRKLWETAFIGPCPIGDPDLPNGQGPELRGLALPDDVLQKLYHDNAVRLLARAGITLPEIERNPVADAA